MKGRRVTYSAEELEWLEQNCTLEIWVYHQTFRFAFERYDVTIDNLKALRTRRGWKTGRTGCFQPGLRPWNTGRTGTCAAGSEKGWFKKGSRTGRANENYKPIGSERFSKEGYMERKIHDGLPLQSRWRAVHLLNWEAINGPIPKSHCLKCLDGNRLNVAPRAELRAWLAELDQESREAA